MTQMNVHITTSVTGSSTGWEAVEAFGVHLGCVTAWASESLSGYETDLDDETFETRREAVEYLVAKAISRGEAR